MGASLVVDYVLGDLEAVDEEFVWEEKGRGVSVVLNRARTR